MEAKMAKKKHWWDGKIPEGMTLVSDDYGSVESAWRKTFGLVRIQDLAITDWDDYLKECLANIIDYPFELMKERIGDAVLEYCPDKESFKKCYETSKHFAERGEFLDPSNAILKILNESYNTDEQWNLTYGFGILKKYEVALNDLFSANRKNFDERAKLFIQASASKRQSARNMTKRFIKDLPKNYDENRDYELRYQEIEDKILIEEARLSMIDKEISLAQSNLITAEMNKESAEDAYEREDAYWTTASESRSLACYEECTYECDILKKQIDELKEERTRVEAVYNELLGTQQRKRSLDEDPISW